VVGVVGGLDGCHLNVAHWLEVLCPGFDIAVQRHARSPEAGKLFCCKLNFVSEELDFSVQGCRQSLVEDFVPRRRCTCPQGVLSRVSGLFVLLLFVCEVFLDAGWHFGTHVEPLCTHWQFYTTSRRAIDSELSWQSRPAMENMHSLVDDKFLHVRIVI